MIEQHFRILVPLDGSELSERVFPFLRLFQAAMPSVEVELLRCFEPPSTMYLIPELAVPATSVYSEGDLHAAMEEYLQQKTEELGLTGVSRKVVMADAPSEILERSEKANMVMMASHGRGGLGRWLMGSVATKVTRGATVPVMVIGGQCMETDAAHPAKVERIVTAFDGSPAAERAAFKAASLARGFGAELHIYHGVVQVAMPNPTVAEANREELARCRLAAQELAAKLEGVRCQVEVHDVAVSTGIVEYADKVQADLLVMGSHGNTGLARWMIGSETEHVLQYAHCPVLVTH